VASIIERIDLSYAGNPMRTIISLTAPVDSTRILGARSS